VVVVVVVVVVVGKRLMVTGTSPLGVLENLKYQLEAKCTEIPHTPRNLNMYSGKDCKIWKLEDVGQTDRILRR